MVSDIAFSKKGKIQIFTIIFSSVKERILIFMFFTNFYIQKSVFYVR